MKTAEEWSQCYNWNGQTDGQIQFQIRQIQADALNPKARQDAEETQRFAISNILVSHCGENLTPSTIDKIMTEIVHEMREGPCSWAFSRG